MRTLEQTRADESKDQPIAKTERMKNLLELHTDLVMNPFFNKKRECCRLKQDFKSKTLN